MLYIILTILKVIGIILLAILILLLSIILLVLFVPVRYRFKGEYYEDFNMKARISWLLGMISYNIIFENGEFIGRLKILFFTFDKQDADGEELLEKVTKPVKEVVVDNIKKEEAKEIKEIEKDNIDNGNIDNNKDKSDETNENAKMSSQDKSMNQDKKEKIKKSNTKPKKSRSNNTKEKIEKDKVSPFTAVINFFKDEDNKRVIRKIKNSIIRLIKHIFPRKPVINLEVGTGDPALTGKLFGILGIIYPLFKGNLHVNANFEEAILKGYIYMKGRVSIVYVGIIILKLLLDKHVRSLIRTAI